MRITIDTAKITKPVAGFFKRTVQTVQTKRLERCARILANAEDMRMQQIIEREAERVVARNHAKRKPQAVKRPTKR